MNEKDLVLQKLPYWKDLTDSQKDFVSKNSSIKHFQKGNIIETSKNACLGMFFILFGEIRVYIISEEGREITLFNMNQNESCVLSASCAINQITFETQMVAQTDCDLLVLNTTAFEKLANENIYVKCFMYELLANRFSSVMWTMQQILFSKIDSRLSNFLLSEYEKTSSTKIQMTHEQIATQISSAREVVAKMLKQFVQENLVELKRGVIILKDLEGLRTRC